MNKVIIIIGLLLLIGVGVFYYQFSNKQVQSNGTVTIKEHIVSVETVTDQKAKEIGLTKYASIKEDQGMLFLFDQPGMYTFWMKNMKFPIDILFINNDTIVSFVENAQPVDATVENPAVYAPEAAVDKVLEIKAGLVKQYEIKKGDKVTIEQK